MLKNIILTISILLNVVVLALVGIYAFTPTFDFVLISTSINRICMPTPLDESIRGFCERNFGVNYDEVDTAPPVAEPDTYGFTTDEYDLEYPSDWEIEDQGIGDSRILTLYPPTNENTAYGEGGIENPLNTVRLSKINIDDLDSFLEEDFRISPMATIVAGHSAYKYTELGMTDYETYLIEIEDPLYLQVTTVMNTENMQNLLIILNSLTFI